MRVVPCTPAALLPFVTLHSVCTQSNQAWCSGACLECGRPVKVVRGRLHQDTVKPVSMARPPASNVGGEEASFGSQLYNLYSLCKSPPSLTPQPQCTQTWDVALPGPLYYHDRNFARGGYICARDAELFV